jgi:MYXO-CTERM domain-containing protein
MIEVERARTSSRWPWLLLALLLAGAVVWFFGQRG